MRIFMRITPDMALMETPTAKTVRPRKARRTGSPTNLYLNSGVVSDAKKLARSRYACSFSELVERLLKAEMARKRGIAHQTFGTEAAK